MLLGKDGWGREEESEGRSPVQAVGQVGVGRVR